MIVDQNERKTQSSIYLDNNATTRIDPRVTAAMLTAYDERFTNPASQHSEGRRARKAIEEAKFEIASALGCRQSGMNADRIILTSGGTESNNLALLGLLANLQGDLVVSMIEHPSILEAAEKLSSLIGPSSRSVRYLPVSQDGQIELDVWRKWIADHHAQIGPPIAMVSIMSANNETGVIQPIEEIIRDCKSSKILFHSDAVQVAGKMPLHFEKLGLDAMTITAHKIHGPVGIGALVVKHDAKIQPQLHGGFQQLGDRPGTESVPLAIGFARALRLSTNEMAVRAQHMLAMRTHLEEILLASEIPPTILGLHVPRLPHTISLAFPGIERQPLQMALDRVGIACSTGSACASGSGTPSHVLQAMQQPDLVVRGAIRLSLSFDTTQSEIEDAANRMVSVVRRLHR
jgi:cysteine desulfurase